MKKLNYIFATLAIVATASCAKELNPSENVEIASGEENKVPMTINVSCAEPETETVLDGLNILWNKDDISVIDGSTYKDGNPGTSNNKFTTTAENAAVAEFTGTAGSAEIYYVISPYVKSSKITTADDNDENVPSGMSAKNYAYQIKDSGKDRLYIFQPGLQKPVTGGYDPNAHYLIGKSDLKSDLELSNLNGLLKFSLTGNNIKEVTLYGNDNEHIAGLAVVEFDEETGKPKIVSYANTELQSSFIRVKPASGDTFAPGAYYISVPPTNFTKGIRVEVLADVEGQLKSYDRTGNSALEVKRAQVTNLGTLDANPDWLDVEIMDFMDFARQNDVASPFQIKIDKYWPFNETGSNHFPSSTSVKSDYVNNRTNLTLENSGYSIYVYATKYICTTHSINGWRIGGTAAGTYAELSGKSGQKIVKVQLISGGGTTHSLTKTDGTTVLEGGAKSTAVYGASQVFCPKVDPGESIHIKSGDGEFRFWSIRVYFGDKNIIKPTHAGTAVTRTATHQISDDGKKMTLKGAFTMPDANFDNDGVEYGFEYQQSGAAEWNSVTCTDIYYTKKTLGSGSDAKMYYGFKCDLTGLGIGSGKVMKYRAWVKGNADAERIYGTVKNCYPSARVVTIDFTDAAQFTDCIIYSIQTAGVASVYDPDNRLITGNFESGYDFKIWGGYGISKSTSGGGLTVGGLLFMPYKDKVGGGACNSWIKLPIKTGKKIEQVAVSLTNKAGYQVNISSSVDSETGKGDAAIVDNVQSGKDGSFTLKLPKDDISADANYYLCIETTDPKVNSITMSLLRIYYYQ